jgi:hypothetical protein
LPEKVNSKISLPYKPNPLSKRNVQKAKKTITAKILELQEIQVDTIRLFS